MSVSRASRCFGIGVIADTDNLISFSEFLFLLTALVTPTFKFEIAFRMFDQDGNGTVDLSEFSKVGRARVGCVWG